MKFCLPVLFILSMFNPLFPLGSNKELSPAKIKKPVVRDLEYQKYAYYKGNELSGYWYQLFRVSGDGRVLTEYVGGYDLTGKNTNILKKLAEFPTHYTFDLDKGTILNVTENWSNEVFSNHEKGVFLTEIEFDYKNLLAVCSMKRWNGYETATEKSRFRLKQDYSYFYMNNTLMLSPRLIDGTKPGIIYVVGPQTVKEAVPGSFLYKGKEILNTPSGSYSTTKIGAYVADPFLAKLMMNTTKDLAIWVEDSPRAMVVKFQNPDGSYGLLAETGIWKDK